MSKQFVLKLHLVYYVFALNSSLSAQKANGFNAVAGMGVSYFFNEKLINRHIDNTFMCGINYMFHNKNQQFVFNPGINFQNNDYHARMNNLRRVHVNQALVGLSLDMLMKTGKSTLIRVGLFVNRITSSSVIISQPNATRQGRYFYGNSDLSKEYNPAMLQSGFSVGMSFLFKLFRRDQKFNIKVCHTASALVTTNYHLSRQLAGEDVVVLTTKARPTMLILGFDINLKRLPKKDKEEEE